MSLTALGWLFTLGVLAHNAEEVLFLPAWSTRAGRRHARIGDKEFRFAVAILSLLLVIFAAAASAAGPASSSAYLFAGTVFAMAANALVRHLLVTFARGRYMPGTTTGLLFNLPLGGLFLYRALDVDYIRWNPFIWTALLTAGAIAASIPVLFAVGRRLPFGRD